MKFDIIALAVVAAVLAAALAGCNWLLAAYAPGLTMARLYLEADIIAKVVMLLVTLMALPVAVLGVIGLTVRNAAGSMAAVLRIAAAAFTVLGALGAAYGWMSIQSAIARVGPVSAAVTAPSYAEALLTLAFGLSGAAVALALAVGARARQGRSALPVH